MVLARGLFRWSFVISWILGSSCGPRRDLAATLARGSNTVQRSHQHQLLLSSWLKLYRLQKFAHRHEPTMISGNRKWSGAAVSSMGLVV
ncbi:uncharacterized protein F4807DRAFT_424737 [Annulohypoxylon truncatum]|uniref:uncharacterized protein n=1 Tax=Annulohypoxylon truncatum TaxID=327061 RepID=UPI0020076816|nr:uncharacterized protein F4807DRAFT_424737 [Annulohypoxylon truncatum]KAI1209879.1 hypothetical protein F4807DRAFT_424737 [Annulohypoxylon truncatum]